MTITSVETISLDFNLVKDLCDEIKQCKNLKALRLEGNTINEEAATAIGKALEKHSEIEVRRSPVNSNRSHCLRAFSVWFGMIYSLRDWKPKYLPLSYVTRLVSASTALHISLTLLLRRLNWHKAFWPMVHISSKSISVITPSVRSVSRVWRSSFLRRHVTP